MSKKALFCSKLFDAASQSVQKDRVIWVEGDRIKAITTQQEAERLPEDYEKVDLTGLFVTPGLIDTHIHLGLSGQANPGMSRPRETIGDWAMVGLKNAQSDLMAGFTSLRVCGDRSFISEAIRDAINRGDHAGPRLMTCGQYVGTTGSHADDSYSPYLYDAGLAPFIADGPDALVQAVRYNIKHGCDFVKFMSTGGVMSPGMTVGMQQMSFEEMRAICQTAEMYGMISSTHAHGNHAIKDAVRAGVTVIDHGTVMDEEAVELMVSHQTALVPTLVAIARIITHGAKAGIPSWAVEKAVRVSETHKKSVQMCYEAGVLVAFGTDTGTPFSFHGEQYEEFGLMQQCGISAEQVLASATLCAAKLMRKDKDLGTLEAGKLADIVAFQGEPLKNYKDYSRCDFVMKGGVIYKKDGLRIW